MPTQRIRCKKPRISACPETSDSTKKKFFFTFNRLLVVFQLFFFLNTRSTLFRFQSFSNYNVPTFRLSLSLPHPFPLTVEPKRFHTFSISSKPLEAPVHWKRCIFLLNIAHSLNELPFGPCNRNETSQVKNDTPLYLESECTTGKWLCKQSWTLTTPSKYK